jgi:hypothetical protein
MRIFGFFIAILFDCKNTNEIMNKGYENALLQVTKAIDKIMIGGEDITRDDLMISKLLGQDITKYRSLLPHVSAAIQLSNNEDKLPSRLSHGYGSRYAISYAEPLNGCMAYLLQLSRAPLHRSESAPSSKIYHSSCRTSGIAHANRVGSYLTIYVSMLRKAFML